MARGNLLILSRELTLQSSGRFILASSNIIVGRRRLHLTKFAQPRG